ncbi:tetraspanin-3 isoform X3 [Hydra vulgaris]|uniref:tetraspanin-3 isoform X3 n=1 Tax=Hydra vulgaris TaxID=6087 RepID=UPI0032E9DBD7
MGHPRFVSLIPPKVLLMFNFLAEKLKGASGVFIYLSVLFVWIWGDYCTVVANIYAVVPSSLILFAGILVLVTGLIGFIGTYNESRCSLGVLFTLLFMMLSIEIVSGTLTYIGKPKINDGIKKSLWLAFNEYYSKDSYLKSSFDKMQKELKCCGVNGPNDWLNISYVIPDSCCIHSGKICYLLPDNLYNKGCFDEVLNSFNLNLKNIAGILIGFAVFQIFGMIITTYVIIILRKLGLSRLIFSPA